MLVSFNLRWCIGGLQEFSCQICGDLKYRGRREFERHFKESKHQQGMRALGIPNNKNFYEVTQIAEALALWTNIQVWSKTDFCLPQSLHRCCIALYLIATLPLQLCRSESGPQVLVQQVDATKVQHPGKQVLCVFPPVTGPPLAECVCRAAQEREKGGFKAEVEEEFEDTEGNVYNKKTFEDLRRQGLI